MSSKNFKKGITVAIWIWIIGGISVAFIIFLAFFANINSETSTQIKRDMLSQFNSLRDSIDLACSSAVGQRSFEHLTLKGVKSIYISEEQENVDPKAPQFISDMNISSGRNLCISFGEEEFRCYKLSCLINMTYIGTPQPNSDMYKLGIVDGVFQFDLTVEKVAHGIINITSIHIP